MIPGDRLAERKEPLGESKDAEPSFHGWLLDRSKTDLPDYTTREKLTWLAEQWNWLGPIIGLGALICGLLAVGVGVMLGGDGGLSSNRSLGLIVGGIASVALGFGAMVVQFVILRWSTQNARG